MKMNSFILLAKWMVIFSLVVLLLSSCNSYQSLTRKRPITRDFLSRLQPEKKYKFELKTGYKVKIYIQAVNLDNVTGFTYQYDYNNKLTKIDYQETFETIEQNVSAISVLKPNPYLIAGAVVIPVGLFCWAIVDSFNSWEMWGN